MGPGKIWETTNQLSLALSLLFIDLAYFVREITLGVIDPCYAANREITLEVIDPCYAANREITLGVIDPCYANMEITLEVIDPCDILPDNKAKARRWMPYLCMRASVVCVDIHFGQKNMKMNKINGKKTYSRLWY